ncbi:hypothetical protein [Streptomyces erythrochromogenes]|uniref:hypothetical protein n=1 Tax=Streptomyces erythrochromogenes TaxID=285574 RepID=UPI0033CD1A91
MTVETNTRTGGPDRMRTKTRRAVQWASARVFRAAAHPSRLAGDRPTPILANEGAYLLTRAASVKRGPLIAAGATAAMVLVLVRRGRRDR